MFDKQKSIFFENCGHVDFNQIDNRLFYRIIRHEWVGSLPENPDIQNVDRIDAQGLVIDHTQFRKDMENTKSVEDALDYLSANKGIASNSMLKEGERN